MSGERAPRPLAFEIASVRIEPVGMKFGELVAAFGDPSGVFPECADSEERIGLWEWGNAFLSREGECFRVELGPSSGASLEGVEVFEEPFAAVRGELQRLDRGLAAWRGGLSSRALGVKAVAAWSGRGRKRAVRLWVGRPEALEFRVDSIRGLAREMLPHPWERPRRFAKDVLTSLRYGRLPRSDARVIARQMDLGNWSFALFCLLSAIEENNLALGANQAQTLRGLVSELELDEAPEAFSDWLK